METINYIILVPMVYLAFAVFFVGIIVKIISILRRPPLVPHSPIYPKNRPVWFWALYDAFLMPSVRRHNPVLWCFLMAFHVCFLLLIIGHLELIKDFRLFQIVEHEVFLGRGVIGLLLSVSLLFFLFRRFVEPAKDLSVPEDYYLLILLFLTVIFGSQMDWARTLYDYEEMGVEAYRAYLMSLLTLKPEITDLSLSGHSFMLILHVFFANLFLMFFPFSKIMHSFFSIPLNALRRG
ncbi:MAG: respiratory nitrate reductase subunit gamma [Desulfatiglans sp.]|jgi:nitrate reductase gamma subunit|nr:respiratory nitrate reductase subunit gamma [Thermodesulfobacteriota bacterium]MEE4354283.1 respiratory nitrate reductase subunit gamma [Desulfatiglans sp.]